MMNRLFRAVLPAILFFLADGSADAGVCNVCKKLHHAGGMKPAKYGQKMVPTLEAAVKIKEHVNVYGAEHVPFTIHGMKDGWYDIGTNGYIWHAYLMKLEDGVAYYTKHIQNPKHVVWARQMRATCWIETGDYALAVAECNLLLAHNAKDPVAYLLRGIAHGKLKQVTEAKADFDKALGIRPDYCAAYKHRGHWYMTKKDYAGAERDFMSAVKHNPKSASAHRYLGEAQFHRKKYDEALKSFQSAIELLPYASDYEWRGRIWELKKDYAKAAAAYAKAHELDPKLSYAATRLTLLKNLAPAVAPNTTVAEAIAKCEQTHWKDIPALYALAKASEAVGDFRTSVWALEKIKVLTAAPVPPDMNKLKTEIQAMTKKAVDAGQ